MVLLYEVLNVEEEIDIELNLDFGDDSFGVEGFGRMKDSAGKTSRLWGER